MQNVHQDITNIPVSDNNVQHSNNANQQISPKRKKFQELAAARTTKIVSQIRSLAKLSSTKNYEFSDEEVEQIFKRLTVELKQAKAKFTDTGDDAVFKFK